MELNAHTGSESPPSRTTILGSFLGRGRPRNSSQSHIQLAIPQDLHRDLSPSPPAQQPPSPNIAVAAHRRARHQTPAPGLHQTASAVPAPTTSSSGLGISSMLRRRRSAGNLASSSNNPTSATPVVAAGPPSQGSNSTTAIAIGLGTFPSSASRAAGVASAPPSASSGPAHRIRLVPHLDSRRTLRFDAIARDLREGDPALRIGRFTDRSGGGLAAINAPNSNKLAFRSKVVSRAHAEIWVETGGKFFIKDTKSSSGTFLNHIRLSPANTESRPYPIKDGDLLQLGVDYQGGAEDIYKSVKIKVELGREWQAAANAFNTNALKNLKALAVPVLPTKSTAGSSKAASKSQIPDCCICLFSVTIRQALFIAPCSHAFHFKCIRPLLEAHHPAFSCPLCRTYANLEEDVEVERDDDGEGLEDLEEAEEECNGPSVDRDVSPLLSGGEGEAEDSDGIQGRPGAGVETDTEDVATNSRAAQHNHVLPSLPGDEPENIAGVDADADMGDSVPRGLTIQGTAGHIYGHPGYVSPVQGHAYMQGLASGADISPDMGHSGMVVDVDSPNSGLGDIGVLGEEDGDTEDIDGTVGGKRKR